MQPFFGLSNLQPYNLQIFDDFYSLIKFTAETSLSEKHFFDSTIHLQKKNEDETEIYDMSIDAHLYLLPSRTTTNIPYFLRKEMRLAWSGLESRVPNRK